MIVFDVEGDGLLDEATKLHCLSYSSKDGVKTLFDYDEMREFLLGAKVLIGHNIIRFDIPLLEKLLDIKIKASLIDTLALSWYVNTNMTMHGLEVFGRKYGFPKPPIDDWVGLTPEEYKNRCETDVKINVLLWNELWEELQEIYGSADKAKSIIKYLSFKLDCAKSAEQNPIRLDIDKTLRHKEELEVLQKEKVDHLLTIMPSIPIYKTRTRPPKPYKKDGTLSVAGEKWFKLLKHVGKHESYSGKIILKTGYKEPNPNSPEQVKAWLFSLGWKPCTFKYTEVRTIPQIRDGGELTQSVLNLAEKIPELKHLEDLSVIQHRIGIFKGFLEFERYGYIVAPIGGLTNTLRFKHKKPLVNLPGVDKPWGEEIRGCLITPKGYVQCGADMVSLEDTTKRHFMFDYDPEYVKEMSQEGFDPHLDLAKHAGEVKQEEIDQYSQKFEEAIQKLSPIRKSYKIANYSCVYGVGFKTLSLQSGLSAERAKELIEAYWERNWSVKELVKPLEIKKYKGKTWLLNPVSGFWYSLRYDKDRFSTLNQSTGVYCFDSWIYYWRQRSPIISGQWHDEVVFAVRKGKEEEIRKLLKWAIGQLNNRLKLNIDLDVDIKFGDNYAEIH